MADETVAHFLLDCPVLESVRRPVLDAICNIGCKLVQCPVERDHMLQLILDSTSRKHLRTKVTPDLHLTYSKNGGNLGLVLNDKKWKFLHKIICCGDLLESPRGGDSNR